MASIGVKLGIDGEAEYRKQLNNIIQSTKTLDKQMGELQSSFDDSTSAMEKNAAETELLQQKAEKLTQEVEMMQQMVDAAAEKYGESSTECQKWEQSLADAQTELNKTNSEIEAHQQAAEEAGTALGQLTSAISEQESELASLRDEYVNAVLEFGEGSDEANALASEISNLSGELANNKARLDEAQGSLKGVEGAVGDVTKAEGDAENATDELAGKFSTAFPGMTSIIEAAGTAGVIGAIVEALVELGKQAIEAMQEVEEASNEMIRATLLTGEGLKEAENAAYGAYIQLSDANASLADMEAIGGTLYTRLGLTGDELERAILLFGQYSAATGTDGVNAVNDLVDVMRRWGLETEDNATNLEILSGLMDKFSYGQGQGKLSIDDITDAIRSQSGAWEDVGYSVDDAIALMAGFTDAGGDVSTLTASLTKAITALDGKTDDMGKAWQDAIQIMTTAKDRNSALGKTIGDTGVTIEQAFGKKNAGILIDIFKSGKVSSENYKKALESATGQTKDLYTATRTTGDGIADITKAFSNYEMILFENERQIEAAFSGMEQSSNQARDTVTSDYNTVKNTVGQPTPVGAADSFVEAQSTVSSAIDTMYNEYEWLRTQISNNPLKIKVNAPQIEYKTYGNANNLSLMPTEVSRQTFAAAYEQAMILSAPTIFGAMGNQLLVGGDRPGNEVVVGERHLMEMFTAAVRKAGTGNINVVVNGAEGQNVEQLADAVIYKLQNVIEGQEAVYA